MLKKTDRRIYIAEHCHCLFHASTKTTTGENQIREKKQIMGKPNKGKKLRGKPIKGITK